MGTLVFQATLGGQVNLTGPNTASTFTISVPAITGTMITSGDTGTVTNTMLASNVYTAPGTIGSGTPNTGAFTTLTASSTLTVTGAGSIQGLTVGRGAGAVASNTAVGVNTLYTNSTGANNVAIGYTALQLGNGSQNTAVGSQAAYNVTGSANTYVGFQSGNTVTSGSSNVAVGKYAGAAQNTSTGSENVAVGTSALTFLTSGNYNTAVGTSALSSNTTASYNTAVGYQAGYSNTTGSQNVAVGANALVSNTTGDLNVAIGGREQSVSNWGPMQSNTTGYSNTAVGAGSLASNTSATANAALGYMALFGNTTGTSNTGVGFQSLRSNTTASNNTAVGYQAGYSNTTGAGNACFGYLAGNNITTGAYGIYIGANAVASGAVNQEVVIATQGGAATAGKGANTGYIFANGGGVYQGNNSAAWSITSDQRIKKNIVNNDTGLSVINQIQVRNFEYRLPEEITDLPQEQAVAKQGVQLGVIAQELQQILPECVKTESTGVMTVDADNLTWYLVNAVKELSAQVAQLQSQLKG